MKFGGLLGGNLEPWVERIMSDSITELLALKIWAVVGLSNNSERAAYRVSKLLIEKGHQIIPIHPKAESVHGQKGYAKLEDIPFPVEVVDIFVNSELAGEVVDSAIKIRAKGVWLQLDVIEQNAVNRASEAGLITVMDRCPAIEYGKRV